MIRRISLLGAFVAAGWATTAFAQTATGTGAGGTGNGGLVEIQVKGTVVSAVSLDVTGTGTTVLTGTTSANNPTAAVGILDFGTFSTQTPAAASNTTFAGRTASGTAGAVVAGSLSAKLTFSGATSGTIKVTRKVAAGALPDVPAGNLRFASPALATWATATDGTAVPNPTGTALDVCTGAGGACVSGTAYTHQLAVFVPDTQAAGAFSTVVTYVGTAL